MADIRPDVHLLQSLRAQSVNYPVLVCEGVDNALDAGANNIAVELTELHILFQDDGSGIKKKNELAIARLGEHGRMATTALGRYGIGITHHAINAGDRLEVHSISADGDMRLRVDWEQIIRKKSWEIEDPLWSPPLAGSLTGTQVIIRYLRQKPPTARMMEKIRDEIAQRFYPAIASDRIISLNGMPVPLLDEPEIIDVIATELTYSGDRRARIRAGMLVKRPSYLYGVQVSFEHRVIMPLSDFGCANFTGTEALFARVELLGNDWQLGKFKDELVDPFCDDLAEDVCDVLRPLLERCEAETMEADVEEVTQRLNEMLPLELTPVRPQRRKPRGEGTSREKQKPGMADAPDAPNGPARSPRSPRETIKIEFTDHPNDEFGYGTVSFAKSRKDPTRIKLTKNNPHVVDLRRTARGRRAENILALRMLYSIAFMLYEEALQERDPAQLNLIKFGLRVWRHVERQGDRIQDAAQ